ncbi:uncharacterized protein LOC144312246 isoform X3 [Canis aureus]
MQMWVVAAGLGLRPRRPPRVVMERSRANHSVIGTGKAKATCLKSRSCPNGYFLHISAQAFPSQTSPLFPGHSSPVHHCVVFLVLGRYNGLLDGVGTENSLELQPLNMESQGKARSFQGRR